MTIATVYQSEIIKLRRRNDWLEAELARLIDYHAGHVGRIMIRLKITKTHATLLSALATGAVMTREMISETCRYCEDCSIRNVDSNVKRLRKKIRPQGIDIKTLYGVGYACEGETLIKLRAIIGDC